MRELDLEVEPSSQVGVVADEYQGATVCACFLEEQVQEAIAIVGVQRRGWFVGDQDLGAANQCSRHRYTLLLANTELGDGSRMQIVAKIERPE